MSGKLNSYTKVIDNCMDRNLNVAIVGNFIPQ